MPRIYFVTLIVSLASIGVARPALGCAGPAPPQDIWPRGAHPLWEISLDPGAGTPRNVEPTVVVPPFLEDTDQRAGYLQGMGRYGDSLGWTAAHDTAALTLQLRTEGEVPVSGQVHRSRPSPLCRHPAICLLDSNNDDCWPQTCGSRWLAFRPRTLLAPGRYELVLSVRDGTRSSVVSRFAVGDVVDHTPPTLDDARAIVVEPYMGLEHRRYPDGFTSYRREILIDPIQESGEDREYSNRVAVWLVGEGDALDYSRPPTTFVAPAACSLAWRLGWTFADPSSGARIGIRLVDNAGNMSKPVEIDLDVAYPMRLSFVGLWARDLDFVPATWSPRRRMYAFVGLCLGLALVIWSMRRARRRVVTDAEAVIADAGVDSISAGEQAAFRTQLRRWRHLRRVGVLVGLMQWIAATTSVLAAVAPVRRMKVEYFDDLDLLALCAATAILAAYAVGRLLARRLQRRMHLCQHVFEHLTSHERAEPPPTEPPPAKPPPAEPPSSKPAAFPTMCRWGRAQSADGTTL